jgi:hypothetical protein
MIFHSHGEFTMSGKRGKSRQGVEHKTKTKSYGRNGERKQSHMDGVQNACNLNDIM